MKNANKLLTHQNTLLKLVYLGLVMSLFAQEKLLIISGINILVMLLSGRTAIVWLKNLLRILPLLISYTILWIFLAKEFTQLLIILSKFSLFLLCSVYLITSIRRDKFYADMLPFIKIKVIGQVIMYISAVGEFFPVFVENWQASKVRGMDKIVQTFAASLGQINAIEAKVRAELWGAVPMRGNQPGNFILISLIIINSLALGGYYG